MAFVFTLLYISVSLISPGVLPEGMQDIHILWIVAALILVGSLPELAESRVASLRESYFIIAIFVAAVLSILMTGWVGGAVGMAAGFLPIIAAYYFVVVSCTSLTRLKILSLVLFAVSSSIIINGMIAVHSGEQVSLYFLREGEAIRFRGLGVISDPNDLAQVLVATAALLWLNWKKGAIATNMLLTVLPACFMCYGVYLTHSRGGLLALIATTLYGFKDRLGLVRSALLTGLLCGALVLFNATGGRNINDDDGDRIGLWSTALSTFKSHPLTGVGVDHFGDYNGIGLTAHNSYVLCLAEMGLFGYLTWMGAIVTSWSGLAAISAVRPKADASPDDAEPDSAHKHSRLRKPLPPRPLAPGPASLKLRQAAIAPRIAVPEAPAARQPVLPIDELDGKAADVAAMVTASHVIRTTLVGVLVSAFFISRTYAITLYVVFGMSAALQVIYQRSTGEKSPDFPLFKRITAATAGSVLFLYLFVRFRGAH